MAKVAPGGLPAIATPSSGSGDMLKVADLIQAMPPNLAKQIEKQVDTNQDGKISISELGELFQDFERSETSRKVLRWQMAVIVLLLGVSIAGNFGTSMYAVEAGRKTDTRTGPDGVETLTGKAGNELRAHVHPLPVFKRKGLSSAYAAARQRPGHPACCPCGRNALPLSAPTEAAAHVALLTTLPSPPVCGVLVLRSRQCAPCS